MFQTENNHIEIARVLQHSLEPLTAAEVKYRLERFDIHFSSSVAEIQAVLESMPARRVEKLVQPGSENKYRWVFKAQLPCSSLVALLEGITAAG